MRNLLAWAKLFFATQRIIFLPPNAGEKVRKWKREKKRERTRCLDLWALCCRLRFVMSILKIIRISAIEQTMCHLLCLYVFLCELRSDRNIVILSYDQGLHRIYSSGTFLSFLRFSCPCSFLVSSSECRRHAHRCDIRKRVIERKRERERLNKEAHLGEMRHEKF